VDAAVDEHVGPPRHRLDDLRQGADRWQGRVELPPAVVRDDDAGGDALHGEAGVVASREHSHCPFPRPYL
jgi:hypothetical protein